MEFIAQRQNNAFFLCTFYQLYGRLNIMERNVMNVTVTGFNKTKAAEIKEAIEFFARQLMHGKMVNSLTIDVEKVRRLDVMGECTNEDGNRNPRWFTINLRDAKDDDDVVKTIAHEMVHIKQYAKNELSKELRVAKGKGFHMASKWMGKPWFAKSKEDPYWDAPWEIEAYGREVGLYHKWVEYTNRKTND
jgi:RNAse (barnase) inhibitor barstar